MKRAASLSNGELWELGQALLGKEDRKISGRVDFRWGAARGKVDALASKDGQLRIGDFDHPKNAVALEAGKTNPIFTLNATVDGFDVYIAGVRLRAAAPVVWKLQQPLSIDEKDVGPAIWTRGTSNVLPLSIGPSREGKLPWAIGEDASGAVVAVLAERPIEELVAGTVHVAKPNDAELAALRAEPQRHAIPSADLRAFGEAIRKHAVKRPPKAKQTNFGEWVEVPRFSDRLRLSFCTTADGVMPSTGGELCFGNFAEPKSAVRIPAGAKNLTMIVDHIVYENRGSSFDARSRGVRLSNEVPVRWRLQGVITPKVRWRYRTSTSDVRCRVGFWTPGMERTADFSGIASRPGIFHWDERIETPLMWMIGFDAKDRPACVLVAPKTVDSSHGVYRFADYFALGGETARKAIEPIAETDDDEDADPLTPATPDELTAIATAIATRPSKNAKKRINERFELVWKAEVGTVKGKLCVGDPNGASFPLAAGTDGPKRVFAFYDAENEAANAWGRVIVGVRLGDGKAVRWKPHFGIGVDSGMYGVWSPTFPLDDVAAGVHTSGPLAAMIQRTAEGDCSFPSLLGIDADKKPVAFLFGEALRPEVFA